MPGLESRQRFGRARARMTRRRFVVLMGVGLTGLATACTGETNSNPGGESDTGEVVIEIEMGDNWFDGPQVRNGGTMDVASEITVPVDRPIRFQLKNVGLLIHNLRIFTEKNGNSIAVSDPDIIQPGEEGELVIAFSEPETLFYWCDFHPFNMFGNLEVTAP